MYTETPVLRLGIDVGSTTVKLVVLEAGTNRVLHSRYQRHNAHQLDTARALLEEARAAGADIFITGDVKYHTALDTQLCLFDVGHHSLEEEMMRRAAIHLQHACPMLEVVFVPSASPFQPVHPRVL